MRPLLLVIAALGLAAQAAAADVPPAQQEAAISVLLAKGDAAGACALAAPLVVQRGDDLEAHFLYGQCLMGLHKPADAAQQYRFILSRNPNAMRVHAELAAAEAAMGDKNSAAAELKTILASNPPPQVRANLEQLLGGLSGSAAKTWTAQFSIGITDDTNVNAGPGAGIVTVFGAPFVLSGSSLRQQDWAATGNATVNYFHAFDDQLGFAATASQQLVEYNRVHGFDYSGTSLVAGPVWKGTGYELFSNVGTSVALLGGHLYSTSWGISPQLVLPIDDTVILNEQISLQRNDYYRDALRSGFSQTVSSSAQWFVGRPGGFVQPRVLFTYEGASIQVDRDQQFAVLLGLFQPLGYGFSLYVEPGYRSVNYQGQDIAFGTTRHDSIVTMATNLGYDLGSQIGWDGTQIALSWNYTNHASNQALYSYRRNQISLQLNKQL